VAILRPFVALRPAPGTAARVASPPYDVVDTREARAIAKTGEASFLFVSRPEIALPEGTDEHSDAAYAQGKTALDGLVSEGALVRAPGARLFLYAQTMGTHRQIGVVACASVDEYDADTIKKHEKTRPDKEDDRTRHIDELGAHDEPVFLTYRARPEIGAIVSRVSAGPADEDFTTSDGVRHETWTLSESDTAALAAAFTHVPALYVADGHHRSAAASRVHARRKGQPGEHDAFLAVIFPHDEMQILAYNRIVRDRQGRTPEALLAALRERFDLVPAETPAPPGPRRFGIYLGGAWWTATPKTLPAASDPVAILDCSICQDQILAPIFGITDPRTDENVSFVGGIRGAAELVRRVDGGNFVMAIHLFPTSIVELLAVSDAGLLMPPKSTWFEPKLRSGLFVHSFAG
jgi:uncharacterized protein (DUF1015 family)